ncbi:hypothetical protein WDZ92_38135, partial [Nostoc sp. NIES-2111]
ILVILWRKCYFLVVCEEQVKSKKRLGWKHGNTPRRFFVIPKNNTLFCTESKLSQDRFTFYNNKCYFLVVCEEQVRNKKRLGWKHGNTPRRFLFRGSIFCAVVKVSHNTLAY